MASHPDANPDSTPAGAPDAIEQVTPAPNGGRDSVEDTPGSDGGTSGTNHRQDRDVTS